MMSYYINVHFQGQRVKHMKIHGEGNGGEVPSRCGESSRGSDKRRIRFLQQPTNVSKNICNHKLAKLKTFRSIIYLSRTQNCRTAMQATAVRQTPVLGITSGHKAGTTSKHLKCTTSMRFKTSVAKQTRTALF